ncbi:MAG TPA: MFS transporter, partial [Ktedonobacteraceae bacterium]
QAASVNQVTQALAIIIGPALASPFYFAVGPVVAVLLNAGSYAVSAFCLWRMRVPRADLLPSRLQDTSGSVEGTKVPGGVGAILREMWAGLAFVLKTRVLAVLFMLGMVGMFGAGSINALDIVFVSQRLHANPNLYGYLMAIGGIGMLVGAICASLVAKRIESRHMAAGSMLAIGIGLSMYTLQTSFGPVVVILTFLFSMPQGMLNVGIAPLLMSSTPRNLMGRVQSLFTTLNFSASLLAIVLSGYLGSFVPVYLLLLGGSVLITVSGIVGLIQLPAPSKS